MKLLKRFTVAYIVFFAIITSYHICSHPPPRDRLSSPRLFSRVDTWVNPYNCPGNKLASLKDFANNYHTLMKKVRVINVIMKLLKRLTVAYIVFFAIITSCSHLLTSAMADKLTLYLLSVSFYHGGHKVFHKVHKTVYVLCTMSTTEEISIITLSAKKNLVIMGCTKWAVILYYGLYLIFRDLPTGRQVISYAHICYTSLSHCSVATEMADDKK